MTLPIQPFCGNENASFLLRGGGSKTRTTTTANNTRRRLCLSAAWADPPLIRKERRRAICSWSVGYSTLTEFDEHQSVIRTDLIYSYKGKVADNATLLDPRGRRIPTSAATTPAIATPSTIAPIHAAAATTSAARRSHPKVDLLAMPGIKTFVNRRRNSGSSEQFQQLVQNKQNNKNGGVVIHSTITTTTTTSSSGPPKNAVRLIKPALSLANLQKCEPFLALSGALRSSLSTSSVVEAVQPFNRLRISPFQSNSQICSHCSSILTLASTSKYSLNSASGVFVQVIDKPVLCKVCLVEVPAKEACCIDDCKCSFCAQCMKNYVEFEIAQGAYDISCPDAQCPLKGAFNKEEIKRLVGVEQFDKHQKYRLNREIELDKNRTWCPRAGCETVCKLCPTQQCHPQCVHCPSCTIDFCSNCKLEWHAGVSCEANGKRLAREGKGEDPGISFNSDLIKCCPMCNVPIEKDEGCAQMMCKRCKHVFCWYCLASLDDDFLLRHYDRGPCKNKLGHSRASVIWHRTQVIGIFAGFGILLLVASPLLLLVAPCIVCCKCRVCNAGTNKLDNEEELPVDES